MKNKINYGWVIQDPDGGFITWSLASLRRECLDLLYNCPGCAHKDAVSEWNRMRREGYRCVKVAWCLASNL
jgi:hypothetical protein